MEKIENTFRRGYMDGRMYGEKHPQKVLYVVKISKRSSMQTFFYGDDLYLLKKPSWNTSIHDDFNRASTQLRPSMALVQRFCEYLQLGPLYNFLLETFFEKFYSCREEICQDLSSFCHEETAIIL